MLRKCWKPLSTRSVQTEFLVARFNNEDRKFRKYSSDVRSHAPEVNRETCVNQNSSLAILNLVVDVFF